MKYLIVFASLLCLLAGCAKDILIPQPDPADGISYANHPRHAEYQSLLDDYRTRNHAPGAILLLERQGEPLWVGASGSSNLAHQTPMRTNTPIRTGSVTKTFTAAAILLLVERGKLRLDDKLSELLPKVKGRIPKADAITLSQLLGHLSGIFDPANESLRYKLDLVNDPERVGRMSIEEMLEEYVYGEKLNFEPGTAWRYCNTNYWLLGQIIESVTQKTLQAALDELIFSPLQLDHTYIEKRDDRNTARGYADIYGDGKLLDVSRWDRADGDGKADGGLVSTATDLAKFLRALMQGELVSFETLAEMMRIQLPGCDNYDCEYGLGLSLYRTSAGDGYGHSGGLVGIDVNTLYYMDTGNLYIVFKNNGMGADKSFLDTLMK